MTIRQNLCLFQGRGQGDRRGNGREREREMWDGERLSGKRASVLQ